jgi:hypothetical protein
VQPGAARDQRCDVSRGIEHLLQIVEHEQHAALADHRGKCVERTAATRLGNGERSGDHGQHFGSGGHRGK